MILDYTVNLAMRMIGIIWRFSKGPLIRTGFIFPLGASLFVALASDGAANPSLFLEILLCAAWAWPLYKFVRYIIRKIKKDPYWKLTTAIKGGAETKIEKKAINPDIPKELLHEPKCGMVFGKTKKQHVCKEEKMDGAALVIGGAGSYKTTAVAIPTIKAYRGTLFAIDIKGELAEKALSADKLKRTRIFNPLDPMCEWGYDPFYNAKTGKNAVQDIREIALSVIPPDPHEKDKYWTESSQNVLSGAMLYKLKNGEGFIDTIDWLQVSTPSAAIQEIMSSGDRECMAFVAQYAEMKTETLGSIWSTMMNKLLVFGLDPNIKRALTKPHCISPETLEEGFNTFIVLSEDKLDQWKSLLTLMVNQHLTAWERRPISKDTTPILMILDECPRLGKLKLSSALATLRGRKIQIMPIIQSVAQLDMIYGKDERKVITDNCPYKVILGASDSETQAWLSQLVGTYDKTMTSHSRNQQDMNFLGGSGVSVSQQERKIIKPEEFGRLPFSPDAILINPISGFCRVRKAKYWEEPDYVEPKKAI